MAARGADVDFIACLSMLCIDCYFERLTTSFNDDHAVDVNLTFLNNISFQNAI